ncbi:hypothetical protein PFDSM3638_04760 [Pyrococcus furiosus DSM 3638]|uniref:Uncharacterized protein n=3 Tax=Pyrococcus furiosus TaxID=2261 RepID=A0A5C0XN88_PYRFU|nr:MULTISPECIES: hypothetical protein [Pyrococcus]AAL81075.1 hypothetical protein PF0951 [Pyrococcus furiosus DSM 3638]AFN03744.1 hypothetical protein PFC_03975 [Pyrococcus furiosus COM1]MDK2870626.1 hypothetical protein [Pyrococcus sp.]QEK78616.1 hypothetical protein PFDSM3638_04760 [Pyrococcus furiosus DSM 3638]
MSLDSLTGEGEIKWVKEVRFTFNGTELGPQFELDNPRVFLRKSPDGNIIGFFRVKRPDAPIFSGTVVFKMTPEGNILWARYYRMWQYNDRLDKNYTKELIPIDASSLRL